MKPGRNQRPERRPERKIRYSPPTVRAIRLNTAELLAVGCKLADGGNAWGGYTCTMNACVAPGS